MLQVAARIRRSLGVELPVRSVFEAPTIVGMATEIEKARALGLKARTPIPQRRRQASEKGASQDLLLSELEKLPADEARNLLNRLLDENKTTNFVTNSKS